MGHYYSEMHVTTPHEEFSEKVMASLKEIGFSRFEIEHQRCFVCDYCSCVIMYPAVHLLACKTGLRSNGVRGSWSSQIYNSRHLVLNQLKLQPTERLQLLAMLGTRSITFSLDVVLNELGAEKVITYSQDLNNQYSDRVYRLVENQPKEQENA